MSMSMPLEQAGRMLAVAIAALSCSAFTQPRGTSTIEASLPGQDYDYVIHVRNTYDYRYNPEVREDRIMLARRVARQFCSEIRVVGENEFKTEIFGLTTGKPDYVVYVKCQWRKSHASN